MFVLTENQPWFDLSCINTTSVNAHVSVQGGAIKAFLSVFQSQLTGVYLKSKIIKEKKTHRYSSPGKK